MILPQCGHFLFIVHLVVEVKSNAHFGNVFGELGLFRRGDGLSHPTWPVFGMSNMADKHLLILTKGHIDITACHVDTLI